MTEETSAQGATRDRSPSFPFISLKVAIARLTEFEQKFGRQDAPADRAYLAWGFKGDTSQSGQTLAAMKAFGLVDYKGSGPKRLVSISTDGRTFLRAQQESIRNDLLKKFALKPKWIGYFWANWGSDRGPDEVCLDTLVLQQKFNPNAAPKFLNIYDETIGYAGLSESDKILDVFQEENETPMTPAGHATPISRGKTPSEIARRLLDESPTSVQYPQAKSPMLQEIFNLDEGPVTLSFPSDLSQDSYEDLKDQLELFLRRAQRRARSKVSTRAVAKEQEEEEEDEV